MNSPDPHFGSDRRRAASSRPADPTRSIAPERLRRAHRNRERIVRDLNILVPARVLDRHPHDLAWRVSVMDRWIARHLDLAGGQRLPLWVEEDEEDRENPGARHPEDPEDTRSKEAP